MAECPQFQMIPQVVPIYQPPPPPNAFPISGQPMFPLPAHFGYPPIAWSPVPRYPPQAQPSFVQTDQEDDNKYVIEQHLMHNNNDLQNEPKQVTQTPRIFRQNVYGRYMSNKFDTKHEEFRKYLEEMGILSSFTNILAEMYKDPLRPTDPLGYIRDKLSCSRPETIELSNLRLWCEQYQTKTVRLEKELKHVIDRLRKYEPYITDESLFNKSNSIEDNCKSCVLDVAKQGYIFVKQEPNANNNLLKNNNN